MEFTGSTSAPNGIGAIFIPSQPPESQPFLITRTIGDRKTTDILIGYSERRLDRTHNKSVVELHHNLRIGMNLETTLLSRISTLESLLQRQIVSSTVSEPNPQASGILTDARVKRLLALPELQGQPTFTAIITAIPRCDLRTIFSSGPNSIRYAFERPEEIRGSGWGLATGVEARLIDAEFLQTSGYRSAHALYRDGEFMTSVLIDRNFLAWGDMSGKRIFPLAFVEYVTNVFHFYSRILEDVRESPYELRIECRLAELHKDGNPVSLPKGAAVNHWAFFGSKLAPKSEWSKSFLVQASTFNADRAAYRLLREVYAWFDHSEEAIPYTTGQGDDKSIDVAAIRDVK